MLHIYSDGSCSGNPGAGGWAYVMVVKTFQGDSILASDSGGELNTTNNRMELLAVINALEALKEMSNLPRTISLYMDSQYVQKGITEWIKQWKRNHWRTSDKKQVKNQDLWQKLDTLSENLQSGEFAISYKWVKGHEGNFYNELCDKMAREAAVSLN